MVSQMKIQRQNYLNRLINKKGNGLIKVVTGIRRCGKSYLLFNLFHEHLLNEGVDEQHIIEIALDDRRNIELRNPDNMPNMSTVSLKTAKCIISFLTKYNC